MATWKDIQEIYSEYNARKGFFRKLFRTKSHFMEIIDILIKDKPESDSVSQQDKFLLLIRILNIPVRQQTRLSYELALKIVPFCLPVETQAAFNAIKWLERYTAFNQSVFDAISLHDDAASIFTFLGTINRQLNSNEIKLLNEFYFGHITVDAFLTVFFVYFNDKEKALRWCDKALSKQHVVKPALFPQSEMSGEVLYLIAQRYERSNAGMQNDQQAFNFYQKSAEMNNPQALFRLGEIYQRCELGVTQDYIKSVEYYLRSIKLGNKIAQSVTKAFAQQAGKSFKYQLLKYVLDRLDNSFLDFKKEITALCTGNEDEKVIDTLILFHQINALNDVVINLIANHERPRIVAEEILAINKNLALKNSQAMSVFALPNITIELCLAKLFTELKNKGKTCKWYEEAIKKQQVVDINNFPNSQFSSEILFFIAQIYEQGEITPKASKTAFNFYHRAAAFNHPQALFKMGEFYHLGTQDALQDKEKAAKNYIHAAELNYESAHFPLKQLATSDDQSFKFSLLKSILAIQNSQLGALKSEIVALCLGNDSKPIIETTMLFFKIKLLDKQFFDFITSHEDAEAIAGALLTLSKQINIKDSAAWKLFASEKMSIESCLARMFFDVKNSEHACEWFNKAIVKHQEIDLSYFPNTLFSSDILFFIGKTYEKHEVTPKSLECYQKAAHFGNPHALFKLGEFYEAGNQIIEPDRTQAIAYYKRAAILGNDPSRLSLKRLARVGDKTFKFIVLQSILALKDSQLDSLKSDITALCVENKTKAVFDVIVLANNIKSLNYQFFSLIASHENAETIALDLLALHKRIDIKANRSWKMFTAEEISIERCLAKMFLDIKGKGKAREWIKKAMINQEMLDVADFPNIPFFSDILLFIAQSYGKDGQVPQDKERALAFYQKAATLNNVQAIMRLGELKQLRQNQNDTDTFITYQRAFNLECRQAFPTLKRLAKSGSDNLQSQLTVFTRKKGTLHLEANFKEQKNESLKNGK